MLELENIDKNIQILIVDDHSLTREMVRMILRQFGFVNITPAENGQRALDRLQEVDFDLIICDWNMPNVTGIEVLRAVRGNPKYEKVKFLMLTAEAYRESVKEAASLKVDGYIAKPFTAGQLGAQLARVFNASTASI